MDWLERLPFHVMEGDGFVINNYGHPSIIRYIEGNRVLTLSYEYVDETTQKGRRFLIFRNYAIHVQVPKELAWDNGTPMTENEIGSVLERICKTLTRYKKRPCHVVTDEKLYQQIEAAQRARQARQKESS